MSRLAQRYAHALLKAAQTPQRGDEVVEQLQALVPHLTEQSPLFGLLMQLSPQQALPKEATRLFDSLKLTPVAVGLLRVLLRNRRLGLFAEVVVAARHAADEQAKRVRARVCSVVPLTSEQKNELESTLSRRLGRQVVAEVEIDKSLMGGLVCHVGHLTIDSSLTSQLRRLAQQAS